MKVDREFQNDSAVPDGQESEKRPWLIPASVVLGLVLAGIIIPVVIDSAGVFDRENASSAFITIHEPSQGAVVDTFSPVTVTGEAGGLFEGNLVIQALNVAGTVLAQQPTTIDSPEAGTGGSGSWSVDLDIIAPPGTQGKISAFSTSPEDGSKIASAEVDVTFGTTSLAGDEIDLRNHLWLLETLNGSTLIKDTLITLEFQDFQVDGLGGCNLYTTSYERRASTLNFGLVTSTAKDCELPIGVMAQEKTYFDALENVASNTIAFQQLNLFDNSRNPILAYNAGILGQVIALEGRVLPEGAVVYIQLADVSLADAEAEIIAEQVIRDAKGFPIPFSMSYDPGDILVENTYAVQVRIEDDTGNLVFTNNTTNNVITRENPSDLDVMVETVQ
jgi:uncharacterized lipoprotein YbaY